MVVSSSTIYQSPRFRVKLVPASISDMSVAAETFQPDMSPLKGRAMANIWDMSVTDETSQLERLPLNMKACMNISEVSVTADRSGASVARYTMFIAPLNAPLIDFQRMSPHCSIDCSFNGLSGW